MSTYDKFMDAVGEVRSALFDRLNSSEYDHEESDWAILDFHEAQAAFVIRFQSGKPEYIRTQAAAELLRSFLYGIDPLEWKGDLPKAIADAESTLRIWSLLQKIPDNKSTSKLYDRLRSMESEPA
jgi:hypothetical protein